MEKTPDTFVYSVNWRLYVDNPRLPEGTVAPQVQAGAQVMVNGVAQTPGLTNGGINPTSLNNFVMAKDVVEAVRKIDAYARKQPGFQRFDITSITMSCGNKAVLI